MCSLVGLSFFFLLVSENMPPSSNVPQIGGYYSVTMIQMGFSFFMNVLVLRFHHMTEKKVPVWVRVSGLDHKWTTIFYSYCKSLSTRYHLSYTILTLAYVIEQTRIQMSGFKFGCRWTSKKCGIMQHSLSYVRMTIVYARQIVYRVNRP